MLASLSPEMLHLIFAGAGMALGWYLKHRHIGLPPELVSALQSMHLSATQNKALDYLSDLVNGVQQGGGSPAPAPMPAAPAK